MLTLFSGFRGQTHCNDWPRLGLALLASGILHGLLVFASRPSTADYLVVMTGEKTTPTIKARIVSGKAASALPAANPSAPAAPAKAAEPAPQETQPESSPVQKLSQRAQPLGSVDLDVPESSLLSESGTLVLKLWISRLGIVEKVEIDKSSLPEGFAKAVAAVFAKVKFAPGEVDGKPVGSVMVIEIAHEAEDSTTPPRPSAQ